jgi:hypothetical protein
VPEVQKENDKEQDRWERHDERDGTEPSEHKRAVAGAGWGQGNSNDVMKSAEQFCQEFDHSCSPGSLNEWTAVNVCRREAVWANNLNGF